MKKSIFTAIAALGLMGAAHADVICDNCEYVYYGSYAGAYWPGDKATFGNRNLVADFTQQYGSGNGRSFDDYWVFDLNNNARVTLTVNGSKLAGPHFAVQIFADTGSFCDARACNISYPDFASPIVTGSVTKRWNETTPVLPPGRYAIRIAATSRLSGESSYSGTLVVKAAP